MSYAYSAVALNIIVMNTALTLRSVCGIAKYHVLLRSLNFCFRRGLSEEVLFCLHFRLLVFLFFV